MWTGIVQSVMILGGILAFYGMDFGLMARYDSCGGREEVAGAGTIP